MNFVANLIDDTRVHGKELVFQSRIPCQFEFRWQRANNTTQLGNRLGLVAHRSRHTDLTTADFVIPGVEQREGPSAAKWLRMQNC